jgi:hypothetical protein
MRKKPWATPKTLSATLPRRSATPSKVPAAKPKSVKQKPLIIFDQRLFCAEITVSEGSAKLETSLNRVLDCASAIDRSRQN